MKYYVYTHKIPRTNIIFYIGSNWQGGNPNRAYEIRNRPVKWHDVVVDYFGAFNVEIVARFDNPEECYQFEMESIAILQDEFGYAWCNSERKTEELKTRLRENTSSKKIVAIKNGEQVVFDSIRYASQQLNIKRPTIHHYLKTGKIHSSGYRFEYLDKNLDEMQSFLYNGGSKMNGEVVKSTF